MTVYLIYNAINGKKYVGITRLTLKARWQDHLKSARNASPFRFHAAIRKHGPEAFTRYVLCAGVSVSEAKELERRFVEVCDSFNPERGYNMTRGGDHVFTTEQRRQIALKQWQNPAHREHMSKVIKEKTKDVDFHKLGAMPKCKPSPEQKAETRRKKSEASTKARAARFWSSGRKKQLSIPLSRDTMKKKIEKATSRRVEKRETR